MQFTPPLGMLVVFSPLYSDQRQERRKGIFGLNVGTATLCLTVHEIQAVFRECPSYAVICYVILAKSLHHLKPLKIIILQVISRMK